MRKVMLLLALASSIGIVGAGVEEGCAERPYDGAITAMTISPTDPNVLYVGTHQRGDLQKHGWRRDLGDEGFEVLEEADFNHSRSSG